MVMPAVRNDNDRCFYDLNTRTQWRLFSKYKCHIDYQCTRFIQPENESRRITSIKFETRELLVPQV